MARLYVVGGQQRSLRPVSGGLEWYEYQKGLILEVDTATGAIEQRVEYVSPQEVCAQPDPVVLFKSATLEADRLYVCTQTEVLIYRVPSFEQVGYVSVPLFNDVHHVRPTPDGDLLVANTGLDMVLRISPDGDVRSIWPVIDEDPWARFSRDVDYRTVRTTKPHHAHPNYVFYVGDEIWATRFEQRDAVSVADLGRRVEIGLERLHDGIVHGGRVHFTTVDGKIVVMDPERLLVERVIDLNEFHDDQAPLGWARGLLPEDDGMWVGFSRIRPTKFRENVAWVARGFKSVRPTRVAHYDLASGRCTAAIDLEPAGLSAVFSVHPAAL